MFKEVFKTIICGPICCGIGKGAPGGNATMMSLSSSPKSQAQNTVRYSGSHIILVI
jgi:hypothetical protein